MLTFVLFVFFVICINFLNFYCIVWVILFHKSCLCLLFADYIISIHFTYLKMFLSFINYFLQNWPYWYIFKAPRYKVPTLTTYSQCYGIQKYFLCNGIRWPLCSYLHRNSESLVIIFVHLTQFFEHWSHDTN